MNVTINESRKPAVLVDIDGTLAHFDPEAVRDWVLGEVKVWPAFFEHMRDAPAKEEVLRLVNILRASGETILLCSGRPLAYAGETRSWLELRGIEYDGLYLRNPGDDARLDEHVKEELLATIRADGFEPWLVIDDRTSVVNHWRQIGLCCLQCAPGDF